MSQQVGERKRSPIDALVDVLAYFAAQKNYGYIDRIGNALDEMTIHEAIRDALRDYHSLCVDRQQANCPNIDLGDVEKATNMIISELREKSGGEIVRVARQIAVKALARKYRHMPKQETK
ncbi:MAG: hypothetical protein ACK4M3_07380, partial [Pyrobaculum sp.]